MTNYDDDKYFSIAEWGNPVGSCDAKVKGKYHKKRKEGNVKL